ncbi:DUF459 domain-containing protein [Cardiobacteriaceae bacterium TAE3-ERU3]|nr:DUF459 domain-containing protein [Cardiobacteriaceae bacterium TAE3-ERU3]
MQDSKKTSKPGAIQQLQKRSVKAGAKRVWLILVVLIVAMVWFAQQSINAYWLQTYQRKSPLQALDQYAWWRAGAEFYDTAETGYQMVLTDTAEWFEQVTASFNETRGEVVTGRSSTLERTSANLSSVVERVPEVLAQESAQKSIKEKEQELRDELPPTVTTQAESSLLTTQPPYYNQAVRTLLVDTAAGLIGLAQKSEKLTSAEQRLEPPKNDQVLVLDGTQATDGATTSDCMGVDEPQQVVLRDGEKVFFAGDSLMQSIAPHLRQRLKKEYDIDSINLSKPSTGLSYAGFFDWPATIEDTLANNSDIGVMMVFIGANDAQAFIDTKDAQQRPVKFRSERWTEVYQQRITRILDAAEAAGVQVVWIGLPHMRNARYQDKMAYINTLLHDSVTGRALWLPIADLLGGDTYLDSMAINGKTVRIRRKDGIHLSREGDAYVADYIWPYLCYASQ